MRCAGADAAGATRDLWRVANAAPPDGREDLLLEAHEIAQARRTPHSALALHSALHRSCVDRIGAEIANSE